MTRKYAADAERFKHRLDQLGVAHDSVQIAYALDISESHAANMLTGRKPLTHPIQIKIYGMLNAAKSNGPEPVEQFDVDLGVATKGLPARERLMQPSAGYRVEPRSDGSFEVVKVAATTAEYAIACQICDFLNGESK